MNSHDPWQDMRSAPPMVGADHAEAIALLRQQGSELAARHAHDYVGVLFANWEDPPKYAPRWSAHPFRRYEDMIAWLSEAAGGAPLVYAAAHAKGRGVVAEQVGDGGGAGVTVGHHHGGGGGGRGHGRRFFGGGGWGGWGWDYPYWSYPYPYDLVIEEVPYAPVTQVSGRGYYKDRGIYRVPGLLAEIAPLVAAGSGGMSVSLELDPQHRLHASICVDGRCYRGSIDVAPLIAVAMTKVKELHRDLHAAETAHAAVGCAEESLDQAGVVLLGAMLDRHQSIVCGSFFDDIGKAIGGVVNTIGNTLGALKGPISAAAGLAAGAAATAIPGVGPVVAPMAGKLAGDLINGAVPGPQQQQAKQSVDQAKAKAASGDPHAQVALDTAHKSAAQTTVAYHLAATQQRAARGDKSAQAQINAVNQSAAKGDPAAQWAQGILQKATSWMGQQFQRPGPQFTAADRAAIEIDSQPIPDSSHWYAPPSAPSALSAPSSTTADRFTGAPLELAGEVEGVVTSGALPMILFVATALGGYAWWRGHARRAAEAAMVTAAHADAATDAKAKLELAKKAIDLTEQAKAGSPPAAPGETPPANAQHTHWYLPPAHDQSYPTSTPPAELSAEIATVGAAAPAIAAIRKAAHDHAAADAHGVVAVLLDANGQWTTQGFATSDDADDWLGSVTRDLRSFVYAAYFDKSDIMWPGPLNEAIGKAKAT